MTDHAQGDQPHTVVTAVVAATEILYSVHNEEGSSRCDKSDPSTAIDASACLDLTYTVLRCHLPVRLRIYGTPDGRSGDWSKAVARAAGTASAELLSEQAVFVVDDASNRATVLGG